jgi:hypothetical protein
MYGFYERSSAAFSIIAILSNGIDENSRMEFLQNSSNSSLKRICCPKLLNIFSNVNVTRNAFFIKQNYFLKHESKVNKLSIFLYKGTAFF